MVSGGSQVSRVDKLRSTYGEGYFHGTNSGYPSEGYQTQHPDWSDWVCRARTLVPDGGRWLDLGCAYGYLVEDARTAGFRAVGCDISRYALTQREPLRPWLAEADAVQLPFRTGTINLITAFDVLEHLENPSGTLSEIARCLVDDGILVATTPDPCRFSRPEPTHVSENTPAAWRSLLQEAGLHCDIRFEGTPHNLVIAGSKNVARAGILDLAMGQPNPVRVSSESPLIARVREGFHPSNGSFILGTSNELYLHNPGPFPMEVAIDVTGETTGHNGAFLLLLDGRVVRRVDFFAQQRMWAFRQDALLITAGGHSLRIDPADGWQAGQVSVHGITATSRPAQPDGLTSRLPFDLFERYRIAALLAAAIRPRPASVLDFGGYIGDRGGHWADLADFGLPGIFTDVRAADSPRYRPESALRGETFDLVLALDVLEHIGPGEREAFLEKLDGFASSCILIAGPMASAANESAEQEVKDYLRTRGAGAHGFLSEHSDHGLPSREDLLLWARSKKYSIEEFSGMPVSMWSTLQKTTLLLSHFQQYPALERLNMAVNQTGLWTGSSAPYRSFFLIHKAGAAAAVAMAAENFGVRPHEAALNTRDASRAEDSVPSEYGDASPYCKGAPLLRMPPPGLPSALLDFLAQEPEILSADTVKLRSDALFLLNESQKHGQLLQNHVELLQNQAALLENHSQNLQRLLQAEQSRSVFRTAWQRLRKRFGGGR